MSMRSSSLAKTPRTARPGVLKVRNKHRSVRNSTFDFQWHAEGLLSGGCSKRTLLKGLNKLPRLPKRHHSYRQPVTVIVGFAVTTSNDGL